MKKINILPICILIFFILSTVSVSAGQKQYSPLWNPNCEKLKKELSGQNLNIVFTEKQIIKNKQKHWVLYWHGIEVLIPQAEYKDVYVLVNKRNQYELMLRTIDNILISLMITEHKPQNDIFSKDSGDKIPVLNIENMRQTEAMYGEPVKVSDLMLLAYETTPDQLTCKEENRIKETAIAIALILKTITSPGVTSAYKNVGTYDGWITKSEVENNIEYVLNIIPSDSDSQFLNITYKLPQESIYAYIPFHVGNKNPKPDKKPPDWLIALNNALELKTNNSWNEYTSVAKSSSISEKSTLETLKNLKLKQE
ncbi:MAG: hypothetical protein ABIK92_15365 [Pseudomonadota bacterium]